jgi:phosphatidylglycerophosphate synthase
MSSRVHACAFALWMVGWVFASIAFQDAKWCCIGGVVGLLTRVAAARGTWTPSGKFGMANAVTLLRLTLVATLPTLFQQMPRLGFASFVPLLLVLDGVDGQLARSRGEVSAFGASLDMETDALTVMVLGLILWLRVGIGAWVLISGLWRYVYAITVAAVPSLGEAPPTRFGRSSFAVLMSCLTGGFLPVRYVPSILLAFGTALVSISFVYSFALSKVATWKTSKPAKWTDFSKVA